MRIKRTTKDKQTAIKKKNLFKVIDESTDDEKDKDKKNSEEIVNFVDLTTNELGGNDDPENHQSDDYLPHLDDISQDDIFGVKQGHLISKGKKHALIDEESDEDPHNNNDSSYDGVWVNIDDLPWNSDYFANYKNYIDDEAQEELKNPETKTVGSLSDADDKDSFIDDESLGYDTTDDEETDDDF